MVNTHDKVNEDATAIALCYSSFSRYRQCSQLNKHQFHSNNTTVNMRSLTVINSDLTWANLCQKKTNDHL